MANDFTPTSAQKQAIDCIDGNLQIIACAGSGKTEVTARRIVKILNTKTVVSPENIVAFTFTEKAAEGLKKRIVDVLGKEVPDMYIGTIHGFCKRLLTEYTDKFADFKVLDTVKNHLFIGRYANQCGMSDVGLYACPRNNDLFLQCVDKLIDDYDRCDTWTDIQRSVLDKYIDCLYGHGYIDFSLLIFEALKQTRDDPSVQDYLRTVKYLVVDEYQDVNDLQEKLIHAIVDYGANICVVGDDDQTIYRFRGSNADNMITFDKRYDNVCRINLEENFRCNANIVDVAEKIIKHNKNRLAKDMRSGTKKTGGIVCAKGYSDSDSEISDIAEQILRLCQNGTKFGDVAVLVRKGKYVARIASALNARVIPYVADSAEEFFEGKYFDKFVETLRILDNVDKAALYDQWKDIVDPASLKEGFRYLRNCTENDNNRLSEIMRCFCEKIQFLNDSYDIKAKTEDLKGFCMILDDYDEIFGDCQISYRINGLLRFLGTQAADEYKYHTFRETSPNENAVKLMTVHKSKGLEFDTVFIPRLNKRDFPVSNMGGKKYYHVLGGVFEENKSKYDTDIEDERKLFYVAVTRAERNLHLSYTYDNAPVSEFVYEAAESSCLQIDRTELESSGNRDYDRSLVEEARSALYDYYGTGNRLCPGLILEYKNICSQGPEAIVSKAKELGLV